MDKKKFKKIFLILFAILYAAVAFVSMFHAIAFFGLANISWIAILLAVTFEIGQAAVLFSILTGASGKRKILPWILMIVLTLVQVLGNVYSSYKYLLLNSEALLKYFKEPIFVWMELPDTQANVILAYIIGAILPVVSLLMTSMVTNYIGEDEDNDEEDNNDDEDNDEYDETTTESPRLETTAEPEIEVDEEPDITTTEMPVVETTEEPTVPAQESLPETTLDAISSNLNDKDDTQHISSENDAPEVISDDNPLDDEMKKQSHFINLKR